MALHGISSLDSIIAEARGMQETGRYINGTVFHAMAEAIAENRQTIAALVAALESVSPLVHRLDERRDQIDAALALARGGK